MRFSVSVLFSSVFFSTGVLVKCFVSGERLGGDYLPRLSRRRILSRSFFCFALWAGVNRLPVPFLTFSQRIVGSSIAPLDCNCCIIFIRSPTPLPAIPCINGFITSNCLIS